MSMQVQLNKSGTSYIAALQQTALKLWQQACEFDGFPINTKFAVFSEENKFAYFYNQVRAQLSDARRDYSAGGYVGLRMMPGRRIEMHRSRRRGK